MARKESRALTILHVEDDENDVILFAKACERAGVPVVLRRVCDGEHAKAYLLGQGDFFDRNQNPLPQIVVLDLKLPRMDGFEFLKWLRTQATFSGLPVLVFTASMSRDDQSRALAAGANSYFVKPSSFDALVHMVEFFRPPQSGERN